MRNIVIKIWRGESEYGKLFLSFPLYALSKLYRACLLMRNYLYSSGVLKIDEVSIRLRDADAILINNGCLGSEIAGLIEGIPTFVMEYRPLHLYNMKHNLITHYNVLKEKKVLAFSGLGDNRSFFEFLRSLGAHVVREISFQDHHSYRSKDIEEISSFRDINLIITTEKDAVKISGLTIPDNLFYLSIEVNIEREQELIEVIQRKLGISGLTLPGLRAGKRVRKNWAN